MQYRNLGSSGLRISEIALGGALTWGETLGDKQSQYLIHQAFATGINLFDVADIYADGKAEVILGQALKELPREQIVVATKCRGRMWPGPNGEGLSKKHILQACENSLRRLQLDYIDLYQIHYPDPITPIDETMEAMEQLVRQGKVVHIGCSNYSAKELTAAQKAAKSNGGAGFISSQPHYNLLYRQAEEKLFPACKKMGIGNIVYRPLAQGVLTGKYPREETPKTGRLSRLKPEEREFFSDENLTLIGKLEELAIEFEMTMAQLALRWCLRLPEVNGVIVGATQPEQLDENTGAGNMTLSDDQIKSIDALLDS